MHRMRVSRLAGLMGAALTLVIGSLLAVLLLQPTVGPSPVAAQSAPTTAARGITVIGEGSVSARPDQAWVSVGVQVTRTAAADALAEANRATEALLAKLDSLGIDRANVQTSGISLFPVFDQPKPGSSDPTVTGYRASNNLTVMVSDLSKVGMVLDGAVTAGANQIGGVRFGIKDDSTMRAQALQAAAHAAQPKAEALAAGLGITLGPVMTATEDTSFSASPVAEAAVARGGGVPIEAGQLTVRVRVQVTYAIS